MITMFIQDHDACNLLLLFIYHAAILKFTEGSALADGPVSGKIRTPLAGNENCLCNYRKDLCYNVKC